MAIQLVGIASVLAMEGFAQGQLPASAPLGVRAGAWGVAVAVVALWLPLLPAMRRHMAANRVAAGQRITHIIMTVCVLGGIGQILLLFPHVDAGMRLIIVIFFTSATPILALATVERPPVARFTWAIPMLVPATIVLWHLAHPSPRHLAVAGIVAVFTAVTMQVRQMVQRQTHRTHAAMLEAEAARAQLLAERAAKTRFIASAWHDLGQPIQAARLFSDQASRHPQAAGRNAAAARADQAFQTVERQLGAMLEHLRIDSGEISPTLAARPVAALLADAAALHAAAAREAGAVLHLLPCAAAVQADADLAGRALSNLVDNALRHADARRIVLAAQRRSPVVQIWVLDDGQGIDPAAEPGLFDDFVQGAAAWRGGYGLGLASARRMARLMGGDLRFQRRRHGGSAFCLELQAA